MIRQSYRHHIWHIDQGTEDLIYTLKKYFILFENYLAQIIYTLEISVEYTFVYNQC